MITTCRTCEALTVLKLHSRHGDKTLGVRLASFQDLEVGFNGEPLEERLESALGLVEDGDGDGSAHQQLPLLLRTAAAAPTSRENDSSRRVAVSVVATGYQHG